MSDAYGTPQWKAAKEPPPPPIPPSRREPPAKPMPPAPRPFPGRDSDYRDKGGGRIQESTDWDRPRPPKKP